MDITKKSILIAGQLKTSRTETIEDYLLNKNVKELGVIGVMSPFAKYNESRCTLYQNNKKTKEKKLPAFYLKKVTWWNIPLMTVSFLVYMLNFRKAIKFLNQKFDLFIGIATFAAAIGIFFRKFGYVDKVVYYCLDYYPPQKNYFINFVAWITRYIDVWVIKNADIIWEISPKIKEGRKRYKNFESTKKEIIVPVCWPDRVYPFVPLEKRERWTLGFVGTLSENQGLQMVIDSMPELIKIYPELKLRVIGHGNYRNNLDKLVLEKSLQDRVIFHGFVKDDDEVNEILSRCVAGIATWTGEENDNSLYADPGKPKQYALVGLPIIITSAPWVSDLIQETGSGIKIEYNQKDFINAVVKMIGNDEVLQKYIDNLDNFKPYCTANSIFDKAFEETR